MPVRLMEFEELASYIDEAEEMYNEFYLERYGPFNRKYFLSFWEQAMLLGSGIIWTLERDETPIAAFAALRSEHVYTGDPIYVGQLTVVRKAYRGGTVVKELMEGVHAFFARHQFKGYVVLTSRVPKLQKAWESLGYEQDAVRYIRRVGL